MIAGCESAEQVQARETQFIGQPLAQVIARIGAPQHQDASRAVWKHNDKVTQAIPIQTYRDGRYQFDGYRYETRHLTCTYVAILRAGYVQESHYSGNDCRRYAPKL